MTAARPGLRALASALGIVEVYHDITGVRRETSDATREALCRAMGHDASSEAGAAAALAALERERTLGVLDPVRVWREHAGLAPDLALVHPGSAAALPLRIELCLEQGARHEARTELSGGRAGRPLRLPLPAAAPVGVHRVRVEWPGGAAEQRLVVAPRTAWRVDEALAGTRGFGLLANLYTLRSERPGHWGFGDLGDLASLVRLCGEWGGDFVVLSPLHAIPARGMDISPYGPTSRLYRSALYVDVEAVPEWAGAARLRERFAATAGSAIEGLRAAARIDYEAVLACKLEALRALHDVFLASPAGPRAQAFAAYCEREGAGLVAFATWEALAEEHDSHDWRTWPEAYRRAGGAAVERFREEHAREVGFRCWVQFELDRQLGVAAGAAREAGLRIGLCTDLAVGAGPGSADTWIFDDCFAHGASVGAPPDAFAREGQDWGVAPWDPHRLRARGYEPVSRLFAAGFRHAGALRIDHVMGLERLFWIPEGRPASEGAYVRYRRDEWLGLLALESRRHRALVVGEDLGTVPADLPRELASWGILSSAVLVFERDGDTPRPPSRVSRRALASAGTHDVTPLAGWVTGRDLELRREVGEALDEAEAERARAARRAEVEAWVRRLRAEGIVVGAFAAGDWCRAMAAFLARTPAPLVALALDDLAGERDPVHLPGIGADRHPGWRRRMGPTLEALRSRPEVRDALAAVTLRRPEEG